MKYEYFCMTVNCSNKNLSVSRENMLARSWFEFNKAKGTPAALTSERESNGSIYLNCWIVKKQVATDTPNSQNIYGNPSRVILETCHGFENHMRGEE